MSAKSWTPMAIALIALACSSRVSVGELGPGGVSAGGVSAGGNNGRSASNDAAGAPNLACASQLDQPLSIETQCPESAPNEQDPCPNATENAVCVWQDLSTPGQRGYRALGCYLGSTGKRWSGVEWSANQPFSPIDNQCPKQAPTLGSACSTPANGGVETCIYPSRYCECGPILEGQWLCDEGTGLGGSASPPIAVQPLCPPHGLDQDRRLMDLSDLERAEWCQWYAAPSGTPRPEVSGHDSAGVADSYPFRVLANPEVCLPELPIALCEQNLRTQTARSCKATLRELDDCIETIRAAPDGWIGHGCAPLREQSPSCDGVIVKTTSVDPGGSTHCDLEL